MAEPVDTTNVEEMAKREIATPGGRVWLTPSTTTPGHFTVSFSGQKPLTTVGPLLTERLRAIGAEDMPSFGAPAPKAS